MPSGLPWETCSDYYHRNAMADGSVFETISQGSSRLAIPQTWDWNRGAILGT
ncbi:MAG: hypothetical protein ABIQ35_11110 [Verrucomicrobiota bacterium]